MNTSERRKRIRSHLVNKRSQLTFAFQILAVCLAFVGVFVLLFSMMLASFNEVVLSLENDANSDFVTGAILISDVIPVIGTLLVAFLVSMLLLLIERTHRIFGPVEAMKKLVASIESGNYRERICLRKDDDFQEIGVKLNTLASQLEEKFGAKQP